VTQNPNSNLDEVKSFQPFLLRIMNLIICVLGLFAPAALAWIPATPVVKNNKNNIFQLQSSADGTFEGCFHGDNSCFMPLKQLEQDYYAPRIVQIAGAYPGLTREEFFAVTSEDVAVQGQWTYDFSDPDGPQLGTVAIESSNVVACCVDPVAMIAEHTSLGIPLPDAIKDPVDIIVLADRSKKSVRRTKVSGARPTGKGATNRGISEQRQTPPGLRNHRTCRSLSSAMAPKHEENQNRIPRSG